MEKKKRWYQSKTKIAAVLAGLGLVLGTIAGWMSGDINTVDAINILLVQIGGVVGVFGFRDLPIVNKS